MTRDKHDERPGGGIYRHGGLSRAVFLAAGLFTVAVLSVVSAAWINRVAVVTRLARQALEQRGLTNFCFRVAHLSFTRVTVEDFALGDGAETLLTVKKAEARFTVGDLLRRRVGRVDLSGVSTLLVVDGHSVTSPVYGMLRPLLVTDAKAGKPRPARARTGLNFSVGTVVLNDIMIDLELAGGTLVSDTVIDAVIVHDALDRYRFLVSAADSQLFNFKADGHVKVGDGAIYVAPEGRLTDLRRLYNIVRLVVPDRVESLGVVPDRGGTLTARAAVRIRGWRELESFDVNAELGRDSAFRKDGDAVFARFQSARVEAGGNMDDIRCRFSAGLSAFSYKDTIKVERETGRLLGMRGSARWCRDGGVSKLDLALDSDLPGRSLSQILPGVLPLAPLFFSDGGTLSVNAGLERAEREKWEGEIGFKVEATRSSAPAAAGRAGCGRASLAGSLDVCGGRAGAAVCELDLSDGYFIRRGVNARGDFKLVMRAGPPYAAAAGAFSGRLKESAALPRWGLAVDDGYVRFEGDVAVTGLVTNPVWEASLRLPESGLAAAVPGGLVEARAGALASFGYGNGAMSAEGEAWLSGLALKSEGGQAPSVKAGLDSARVKFKVRPFEVAAVSNMLVEAGVSCKGGHCSSDGARLALEDLCGDVNLEWSPSGGLDFGGGERLTWRRLEAQGLRAEPGEFRLERRDGAVEARLAVRVEGCAGGVDVRAVLPLADVRQSGLHVVLPEATLEKDGVVAEAIRARVPGVAVSGSVSAAAEMRLMGSRPYVTGRVKLREGHFASGDMAAEGVAAEVAFEKGVFFRTIERPFMTFERAKVGKLLLDAGRLDFHLTPQELFVDRLEIGWCKGRLNAYSVHLDFKNPKDDFIVYADRIDLGEALMMALSFRGQIEGYLYGRFPVGIDRGRVKLSSGFLYSLPGQSGRLKLDDSGQMLALLEKAGIKGEVQVPLSKALSDMDFSSARLDLETLAQDQGVLKIKLGGKSNYKEWPAPVDLNLNLHGPMEELLNMGLDMSRKQ